MEIRRYETSDASATLAVFLDAVTLTASADYSPAQIAVWARSGDRDVETWHEARSASHTFVAVLDGVVAGFADIDDTGHVGMMYVAPAFGRRGVASALLERLLTFAEDAGLNHLTTDASITARPFFERHGFEVIAPQRRQIAGVEVTNYRMSLRP